MYYRQSLCLTRRTDLEISDIETIWAEVTLPSTKPFLICSVYRPPNACSNWIDLFENELSKAQTAGFELILMGDLNIDFATRTNSKWNNLIQLFDLTQLVSKPTRVTNSTATIIDHDVYTTNNENIIECFVPHYAVSDHFPVCITRKINYKIPKSDHVTTTYRCFKKFDETSFLADLTSDMENFKLQCETIDGDFALWHSKIIIQLDKTMTRKVTLRSAKHVT